MIRYSDFKNFAFQSTPSAWRETFPGIAFYQSEGISIHSLRMEGDLMALIHAIPDIVFQSTPSAWRETTFTDLERQSQGISIHSLRMEGDPQLDILDATGQHFNPLPPHGGRQKWFCIIMGDYVFQSTPSAWRETCRSQEEVPRMVYFNPLPPHGGRPMNCHITMKKVLISIHSLRMEGDQKWFCIIMGDYVFQSTPSAWRETAKLHRKAFFISPILVQSCKKGCKRLHSAPEKMVFFEKREKNLVRNLQHLSVRL